MKAGLKIEFLLNTVSQVVRYFLTDCHNTRKTGIYTIVEKTRGRPAKMGRKRKYSSYQGEIGKKAENLIQRQLEALKGEN